MLFRIITLLLISPIAFASDLEGRIKGSAGYGDALKRVEGVIANQGSMNTQGLARRFDDLKRSDVYKVNMNKAKDMSEAAQKKDGYVSYKQKAQAMHENAYKDLDHYTASLPKAEGRVADKRSLDVKKLLSKYRLNYKAKSPAGEVENDLLVFVSLSMSEETLKGIAQSLDGVGGIMVLRGMQDNSMTETVKAFAYLNGMGVEAIIHPELFKQYGVTQVPSYVLRHGDVYDKITGNVSLNYALDEFAREGDNKKIAVRLIKMKNKLSPQGKIEIFYEENE